MDSEELIQELEACLRYRGQEFRQALGWMEILERGLPPQAPECREAVNRLKIIRDRIGETDQKFAELRNRYETLGKPQEARIKGIAAEQAEELSDLIGRMKNLGGRMTQQRDTVQEELRRGQRQNDVRSAYQRSLKTM